MILGPKILLKLVKEKKLVEGLAERELINPEGAGFDIRLGEIYEMVGGRAFLGVNERETPKVKLVAKYNSKKVTSYTIKPGKFVLMSSLEVFNIPHDITVNFKPRTTTFRSGLIIRTGNVAPGYQGKVTFAAKNEGIVSVTMELGCRFAHAQFEEVKGGGSLYRGQWQGGRVTTKHKERQV